jgi:hypothetical protein
MREIKLIRGLNEVTFAPTISVYLGDVFTGVQINMEVAYDLRIYEEPLRSELLKSFDDYVRVVAALTVEDITEEEIVAIQDALKNR